MLWLLLCMVGAAAALDPPLPCPCGNARLCGPLDAAARAVLSARPEVTAFYGETSTSSSREILSTPSYWLSFDWGSITTVAVNGWFDRTMVCYAHSRGVRVVALVGCAGRSAPRLVRTGHCPASRCSRWKASQPSHSAVSFWPALAPTW